MCFEKNNINASVYSNDKIITQGKEINIKYWIKVIMKNYILIVTPY